jgi:hypothetical protein
MFAIIAAVLFGLALILNLAHQALGPIGVTTLMLAGLVCVALHFGAPIGRKGYRGRRPGPG